MDKIRKPQDLKIIKQLKKQYWEKLKENLEHTNILENIALAIKQLLKRVNVPEKEIEDILQVFCKKEVDKMFEMVEEYDVQKVRAKERMAGKIEGKIEVAERLLTKGMDIIDIIDVTKLSKEQIEKIKRNTHH